MTPVVLFRGGYDDPKEPDAITRYFPMVTYRAAVPKGSLVVCRYSALPFYRELCQDLEYGGSTPINSLKQHRYLADLGNWYRDLEGITPCTWAHLDAVPAEEYPIVLKGETNSAKWQWRHKMLAHDRAAAIEIRSRLQEDSMIGSQSIYARKLVALRRINPVNDPCAWTSGPPRSREVRFFVCDGTVLCGASYWPSCECEGDYPDPSEVPTSFLQDVIDRVGANARFYVIDVAQTEAGHWIVIELNDGQMSGLSDIHPDTLYQALHRVLQPDDGYRLECHVGSR